MARSGAISILDVGGIESIEAFASFDANYRRESHAS